MIIKLERLLSTEDFSPDPNNATGDILALMLTNELNPFTLISNLLFSLLSTIQSCYVSSENLVLNQLIIPKLIFSFILVTYLVDIVLILAGEILSWSLVRVKGLKENQLRKDFTD